MDFSSDLIHLEIKPNSFTRGMAAFQRPLSIAPMVDHTDRHFRFLTRLIVPRATLYTEMLVAQAIVFGDQQRLLGFSPEESPVIAQIGGSDPELLATAVRIVTQYNYAGINLNLGCPSKRVTSGGFGACLMESPANVALLIQSLKDATHLPVTVKCRLGTDQVGGLVWLRDFIAQMIDSGADGIVLHARIADLSGVSTRYNLSVPPLDYKAVELMQKSFKTTPIVLNGGLDSVAGAVAVQAWAHCIMVGRMALKSPAKLAELHNHLYQDASSFDPFSILKEYRRYMSRQLSEGKKFSSMSRHLMHLFTGYPGARLFRQHLANHATRPDASVAILDDATSFIGKQSKSSESLASAHTFPVAA